MQLELVKKELFGEVNLDIYSDEKNEVFMTAYQLGVLLGYKHPQRSIDKFFEKNTYLQNEVFSVKTKMQATDGKFYNTRLISEKGIIAIVSICHRPLEIKNSVLKLLSDKRSTHSHFKSRDEDEYIHLIQVIFKPFFSEREVGIGNYRCDLLFPEHNLIIECDEYGHQGYDKNLEIKRETYLKKEGYKIIRFNPNADDFYIGDTLNSILESLMDIDKLNKQKYKEVALCN